MAGPDTPQDRAAWRSGLRETARELLSPPAATEQETGARRSQQFNCSDPPGESCSDAACPVHADGDDPGWGEDFDDEQ